ncbi:unnamed protein product [Microthlaspi erraticum]|uniref:Uncharacterized protein n=1 Tax=Microthlaspi erraticum TaxID=1685480 RepID=A0A6D2KWL4_9BRAS|nr:unnamed protein product [Microthlaspi erraticum]
MPSRHQEESAKLTRNLMSIRAKDQRERKLAPSQSLRSVGKRYGEGAHTGYPKLDKVSFPGIGGGSSLRSRNGYQTRTGEEVEPVAVMMAYMLREMTLVEERDNYPFDKFTHERIAGVPEQEVPGIAVSTV